VEEYAPTVLTSLVVQVLWAMADKLDHHFLMADSVHIQLMAHHRVALVVVAVEAITLGTAVVVADGPADLRLITEATMDITQVVEPPSLPPVLQINL
jgi:hypothetical protein